MNDADIDLINKTFYPGWLMVSQLRSGQEVKDGEALYRRACRWVNAARESLTEAGFSTTSCDHMLYAYCALMDESVLKPTLPAYPPAEDRFHWRVMSHLGSRFLNMMSSAEVLRGTLSLYNWRDDELNNRRLDAILDVRHHRIQRFEDGFLLRGLDVEVTLDSNGFTGEGDIHLFGELLNRFFALYADMNQFNQLTLIVQPEGKYIRWKENHSPRLPG